MIKNHYAALFVSSYNAINRELYKFILEFIPPSQLLRSRFYHTLQIVGIGFEPPFNFELLFGSFKSNRKNSVTNRLGNKIRSAQLQSLNSYLHISMSCNNYYFGVRVYLLNPL